MAVILLRIQWDYGCEYLQFDTHAPYKRDAQVPTTEWWPTERKSVKYLTTCLHWELEPEKNKLKVSLLYEHKHNEHFKPQQVRWGRSDIEIDINKRTALAEWFDKDNPEQWNGPAKSCKIVNEEDASFFADMSYDTYLRVARPGQAQLREEMLKSGKVCALTGCSVKAVLDIAHIQEAKDGGKALWENCMLLRADAHRLFDAGLLGFTEQGKVLLHESVSGEYSSLRKHELDSHVLSLVREAVSKRDFSKLS